MKKYLISVFTSPVFSGSMVMIVGSNATNVINYLYHLIMGRLLGPASYGELATLISILGLASMIPFSLGLVIVKFVSSAKNEKETSNLIYFLNKKFFLLGLGMFLLIFLISFSLSSFLNIKNPFLLVMIGGTFICSIPALFYRAVLQGLLRFNQLVISTIGENLIKLILAIVFVLIGLSIQGVIIAFIIASLSGLLISRYFIQNLKSKRTKDPSSRLSPLILYSVPILIQSFAMTSLYSSDLILVKHFFSTHDSGLYAALSNLGKIIFFGSGPIAAVMFPMVAKKQTVGESYRKVFLYSFGLTVIFALFVLLIYWIFPEIAIRALYGSAYLSAASLLFWFGLFMTLFTIASLFLSFQLSLGKTWVVIIPLVAATAQMILIWFYHDSLKGVIFISIGVCALLTICLGVYSLHFGRLAKIQFFQERIKVN